MWSFTAKPAELLELNWNLFLKLSGGLFYIIQKKKVWKSNLYSFTDFVLVIEMSKPFMLLLKVHKYNNKKNNPENIIIMKSAKLK